MKSWIRNAAFLLLVGCSLERLGLVGPELYRLFSLLSFLAFIATFRSGLRFDRSKIRRSDAMGGAVLALTAIGLGVSAPFGHFHLYLFLSAAVFLLASREDSPETRDLGAYVFALAGVGILAELDRLIPLVWHVGSDAASVLSAVTERIAREERNLGPTAMGLPLLTALFVLAAVRNGLSERRRPRRLAIQWVAIGSSHLIYLVALTYYARWIAARHTGWDGLILNSQHLFVLFGSLTYTIVDRGTRVRTLRPFSRRALAGSLAAGAGAVLAAFWLGWAPPSSRGPGRVLIYDAGYVNWLIPVHGKYGERSAGMFGMLPSTLEAVGFRVSVTDDLSALEGGDPPDCVLMINLQRYFDAGDKHRIWNYIRRGGGLICLGDHTGVAGIRGPFNDLLKPTGIQFLFDSSTFFGKGWNDALEFRNHPLNRGVRSAEDFQIWVGATLELGLRARPVIVGRYGYSDWGNPANIERSYLGDRRYNPDERLGDVVLVADARLGKGKVMVYGDTSGFQNLSLARTLDTVAGSINAVSSGGRFGPGVAAQVLGLFIIVFLVGAAIATARSPLPMAAAAMGLALASVGLNAMMPARPPLTPRFLERSPEFRFDPTPHVKREVAVLDCSHGGRFTLRAWESQSLGGLQMNLARNGYFPLVRDRFRSEDLEEAALWIVVAPTRRYSGREIDAFEKFLARGGKAIVAVGFEEFDGARDLLGRFGLSVENVPLGRLFVTARADTVPVQVYEGWPVRMSDATAAEVLLSEWNTPVAVRLAVGKGELIVIGDSSFFYDVNLETRTTFIVGNVHFLRKLTAAGGAP